MVSRSSLSCSAARPPLHCVTVTHLHAAGAPPFLSCWTAVRTERALCCVVAAARGGCGVVWCGVAQSRFVMRLEKPSRPVCRGGGCCCTCSCNHRNRTGRSCPEGRQWWGFSQPWCLEAGDSHCRCGLKRLQHCQFQNCSSVVNQLIAECLFYFIFLDEANLILFLSDFNGFI